jgi:ubiquinone/menaquinone biosynthesis C-methylase UbiE
MTRASKDWNRHVRQTEELARTAGFRGIRDRIVALARPRHDDVVVDVGAGTGLLSLAVAPSVSRVWAIDISPVMTEYLRVKAASAQLQNLEATTVPATSLPLVDKSASVLVSNYCYHHLSDADKEAALSEAFRVLRPGGRIVVGNMMFRVQILDRHNRRVITAKVKAILRRGPAGLLRLIKNGIRFLGRRWEQPADAEWWRQALGRAGFEQIEVQLLDHEGGIVSARRAPISVPHRGIDGHRHAMAYDQTPPAGDVGRRGGALRVSPLAGVERKPYG